MKDPIKVAQGKKSKAAGQRFELKVREDLEKKGRIVDKWTNNVEFGHTDTPDGSFTAVKWKDLTLQNGDHYPGPVARLVKAKAKWAGPGRPMMMGAGFPDFIAYRKEGYNVEGELPNLEATNFYEVIGVESKMDGKLDKEEKAKCRWLLDDHKFSKIWIASKGEKRGEIKYVEFK